MSDLEIVYKEDMMERAKIDQVSSASAGDSVHTPVKRCPTNLSFGSFSFFGQIIDKSMSDLDIVYKENMIGKEFKDIDLELEAIAQEYIDYLTYQLS